MYLKIFLSYSGLNYSGVYGTNNSKSIMSILKNKLEKYLIKIQYIRFRSRTDAKVSSYLQYFLINTNNNEVLEKYFYIIKREIENENECNLMLHKIEKVNDLYNKTYGKKVYLYKIINHYNAVTKNTHYYCNIDNKKYITLGKWLAEINNKKLDYKIFCKELKHNQRPTIQKINIKLTQTKIHNMREILIKVIGDCFMYKQVRMMIGTFLKLLNSEKFKSCKIIEFIENFENKKYVYTAPAHALYLYAI